MDKMIDSIDLSAIEISDLISADARSDETPSQVMAASTTTSGCACSSCSSTCSA
ncbi:thiocillin/thiostrepton family thiazolyl peptide [Sphaerisporangium fuscum]|uniref:thiocillin/thiostrepton family thiazolyl peptide n=1 Tax=Sphaerisporangium fuscum TaxID=2835868 RepID=UPI002029AC44|nr:thiocillin/thiostrepton family thiazolyl peptide [Sphaerisporangium fuscum]